jgi:hypothetical protein
MAGPSKKIRVSNEQVLYELLHMNEYSDISESEYSSDSEINGSDNSSMQHGIWAKSGAERPRFLFTGKPGIIVDLEDPSNSLEYSELFCTQEIAEVIARETNRYSKKFVENTPNLKLLTTAHHWKEKNRNEIMMLLASFLLQGLHQKPDNKSYFSRGKFWKHQYFWTCSVRGGFTFYSSLFILLKMKIVNVVKQGSTAKTLGWPRVLHRFQHYHKVVDF